MPFVVPCCSLLSEELAAAVENLVMLPNIPGVSETSRDSGSSEAVHDYAEIYTPSREGMNWSQNAQGPRPPTPPLHRFPSWEAKIYQVEADTGTDTPIAEGYRNERGFDSFRLAHSFRRWNTLGGNDL